MAAGSYADRHDIIVHVNGIKVSGPEALSCRTDYLHFGGIQ